MTTIEVPVTTITVGKERTFEWDCPLRRFEDAPRKARRHLQLRPQGDLGSQNLFDDGGPFLAGSVGGPQIV